MNVLTRIEETFGIFLPSMAGQEGSCPAPKGVRRGEEPQSATSVTPPRVSLAMGSLPVPPFVLQTTAARTESARYRQGLLGIRLGPSRTAAENLAPPAEAIAPAAAPFGCFAATWAAAPALEMGGSRVVFSGRTRLQGPPGVRWPCDRGTAWEPCEPTVA